MRKITQCAGCEKNAALDDAPFCRNCSLPVEVPFWVVERLWDTTVFQLIRLEQESLNAGDGVPIRGYRFLSGAVDTMAPLILRLREEREKVVETYERN